MAAQEYFKSHIPGAPQQPVPPPAHQTQPMRIAAPPPPPQTPSLALPYPLFDGPPPPYSPGCDQRPHSQPPPQQRYRQQPQPPYQPSGLSQSYRPPPPQQAQSYGYPPDKLYPQTQQYGAPQDQASQQREAFQPQQYPPQQPQYQHHHQQPWPAQQRSYSPAPAVQPPSRPHRRTSTASSEYPPNLYRPDPRDRHSKAPRSRSRSRSRSHERRRHDRSSGDSNGRKKKGSVNTFLGASGGALVGDLIFPGLGTLGGALLGGLGGHEYGKGKKGRSREGGEGRRRRYSDEDGDRRGRKY